MGGIDLAVRHATSTSTHLVISTGAPGVEAEDMDVTITGHLLCIKAEIKAETKDDNASFIAGAAVRQLRSQRHTSGSCQGRQGTGPVQGRRPDPTLPKAERAMPKVIKVKAESIETNPQATLQQIGQRQASLGSSGDLPLFVALSLRPLPLASGSDWHSV